MNQAEMTPERWKRMDELFGAALELPKEERAQFLAGQCRGDSEMRREVESLLEAHYRTADSWEKPVVKFPRASLPLGGYLAEGTLLLDRFKIVRRVGSGGMGDVYEATDLELGRIAIKTIRPDIAGNAAILARFKSEVKLARSIRGPNICHIYELYVPPKESGCPCSAFLTMEFLDGVTLAKRIATDGPMAPKEALKVAAQLCVALQSIHDAGVVHRDLKPGNIMLVPRNGSEQAVVMDFGLARALAPKSPTDATDLTVAGGIMGTPAYMAPEQFEGGEVSPATDIYALGIVLYELVTGQQPFAAPTPFGTAVRHARQPDPPSSIRKGVSHIWDEVIDRCMEYDPARRYQSADEVLAALNRRTLLTWRFGYGQRISLTPRVAVIAGVILLGLLSASGWTAYRTATTYRPSPAAKTWYDDGVAALRDGTYLMAANFLTEAVNADPRFALAHARLAEAWAELDSTGQAQQEMLLATEAEHNTSLADQDKQYVDAVQATLIRDYSAASQDYEELLQSSSGDWTAERLLDLGRAYEKAGKIKQTMYSYVEAARKNPDDPAPFVHLGIWRSRQRDKEGADRAFKRAEYLYGKKSNNEGLAEVAYQRGYAANEAADSDNARTYLGDSFSKAQQIVNPQDVDGQARVGSPQLEARTLSQLCSVDYHSNHIELAINDANREIEIAEENGLEYWSTDGFMRLGNAYLTKGDLKEAEDWAQKSLALARKHNHPRLEADDDFTLASIRDQEGTNSQEQIDYATKALRYFTDFGFLDASASSWNLIIRGELSQGSLSQARSESNRLLASARKSESKATLLYAEDLAGSVSLILENYPEALDHYQRAVTASEFLHESEAEEAIARASALCLLGQCDEAEETLHKIPAELLTDPDTIREMNETVASIRLTEGKYTDALGLATSVLNNSPDITPDQKADLEEIKAVAEGKLGRFKIAHYDADQILASLRKRSSAGPAARAGMVNGELFIWNNQPDAAFPLLESAAGYFSKAGLPESEWRCLFLLSKAEQAKGDRAAASRDALGAAAILKNLRQTDGWRPFIAQYSNRPDIGPDIRELTNQNPRGEPHNEKN